MDLKTKIEKKLDGFEKNGYKFGYDSGVLKAEKNGRLIFEERIEKLFFTKNLIEEISHILHHHGLHEADEIVGELLENIVD